MTGLKTLGLLILSLSCSLLSAAETELTIQAGTEQRVFSRQQLLGLPELSTIVIPEDATYGGSVRYLAVPIRALLKGLTIPLDYVLQAQADDGFVASLPLKPLLAGGPGQSEAWLAIEPADDPWPVLPGRTRSAGPFYLVWLRPERGGIRSEQWPYQLARLTALPAPLARWPELQVSESLPAGAPEYTGLKLFVTQCLVCHRMNGAGDAAIGPDLNLPMNPTEYLSATGLHALIRDPGSVRDWPARTMPGFTPDQLSDIEIEQIIAYLRHMATRKQPAPLP